MKRIGEPHLRFMRRLMMLPDWCNATHEVLLAKACNCIWNLKCDSYSYKNMETRVVPQLKYAQMFGVNYEWTEAVQEGEMVQ